MMSVKLKSEWGREKEWMNRPGFLQEKERMGNKARLECWRERRRTYKHTNKQTNKWTIFALTFVKVRCSLEGEKDGFLRGNLGELFFRAIFQWVEIWQKMPWSWMKYSKEKYVFQDVNPLISSAARMWLVKDHHDLRRDKNWKQIISVIFVNKSTEYPLSTWLAFQPVKYIKYISVYERIDWVSCVISFRLTRVWVTLGIPYVK